MTKKKKLVLVTAVVAMVVGITVPAAHQTTVWPFPYTLRWAAHENAE